MGLPVLDLLSPSNGSSSDTVIVCFDVKYTDPVNQYAATSMTVEIDTVNTFNSANLKSKTYVDQAHNTQARWIETLFNGTWYWRVTATNSSGTTVSTVYTVIVANIQKRVLYQFENVAVNAAWNNKRTLYEFANVGCYTKLTKRTLYEFANVEYVAPWNGVRALYEDENITSDPPFPTLYSLSTTRGAGGSIVTLYGNGFGSKYAIDTSNVNRDQRGYGGYVYIGELLCNILSWNWNQITVQIPPEAESGAIKVRLTAPTTRDSNLIGFEVYESEYADDIGIELFVCDKNNPNTIVCQLDGAKSKSFQALMNNPGSGKFSISRYDSKGGSRDYLTDQTYILCRVDGLDLFKFIVESINPSYVDDGEQQMIEVSGRGILSILEKAVVYPYTLINPTSLERTYTNFHAGGILRMLILEAQARGCFPGLVVNWTMEADSIGNPFDDSTSVTFHAGTPLTEVVEKFTNGMGLFDIEITPNLKLNLYKTKGIDKSSTVIYRPGQGIIDSKKTSNSNKIENVLLVEGENGSLVETTHSQSQLAYGRKEGYLQARNIPDDWAQLENYGQMLLRNSALIDWAIQGTVTKFLDDEDTRIKPFESYMLGDWIGWYIPPEGSDEEGFYDKLKVKGITCEENDDNGVLSYTLDLNNIMLEREIRLNQHLERMSMYTASGSSLSSPSTAPSATKEELSTHTHKHGDLTALDIDDHTQYYTFDRHADDPHADVTRVSGIKKQGGTLLIGDITLIPGNNVTLTQNDEAKTITISATGGGSGEAVFFQGRLTSKTGNNFICAFNSNFQLVNGIIVDNANGKLTALSAGKYKVSVMQLMSNSGGTYLQIRKNGVAFVNSFSPGMSFREMHADIIFDLAIGDYVDFYYSGDVSSAWTDMHSSVTMMKIGS